METFTQPKITGYRQLTATEAALMNEGKALAELPEPTADAGAEVERLRATLAAPAVPPGWVLVPVNATPEMKAACVKATKGWWDSRAWPAMLAAAPSAPQSHHQR